MILNASQRGGASQLGVHLLKSENEHIEVHEVRGFMSDDVKGAIVNRRGILTPDRRPTLTPLQGMIEQT